MGSVNVVKNCFNKKKSAMGFSKWFLHQFALFQFAPFDGVGLDT